MGHRPEGFHQFPVIHRLCQVGADPEAQSGAGVLEVREGGQQDDGNLRVRPPDGLSQLQPVHHRHSDVRKEQVHRVHFHVVQHFPAVGGQKNHLNSQFFPGEELA